MPANKREVFGPVALTTTYTTNIIAPAAAGASAVGYTATATYILIYQIRIVNKGAASSFRLYKGATGANAAGSEISAVDQAVPANATVDIFFQGGLRLEGTNGFIVGGAADATRLTLTATGELGLV